VRRAAELNQPPFGLIESAHAGSLPQRHSYASDGGGDVVVTSVKLAEDGDDLVVRIVETAGRPATARLALTAIQRELTFEIGPFEIRTFRFRTDASSDAVETDLLERPLGTPTAAGDGDRIATEATEEERGAESPGNESERRGTPDRVGVTAGPTRGRRPAG
jgi:hypothetical protein